MNEKRKIGFFSQIKNLIFKSDSSTKDISASISVGIFWALNPLIGTHFYFITLSHYFLKIFSLHISIGLAYAFSYILNPLTIIPLFTIDYWVGNLIFYLFDLQGADLSIQDILNFITSLENKSIIDATKSLFHFFFLDLGVPILLGSVVVGIISAIISYYIAFFILEKRKFSKK